MTPDAERWLAVPDGQRPPHLQGLNPEQLAAVVHRDGPLLILAGAGSGKTRVLTQRIAHLLSEGVEPEQLLAVTFTNKAATEMKVRVAQLVGEVARKVWVSTFHSACCRILRQEAEHLGYTTRFAIYDDDDQVRVVRQIVADLGLDPALVSPRDLLGRIDHYKNRMMTVDDVVEGRRIHAGDPLLKVWRAYDEQLRAADAVDFNDLIGLTVRLFREHPAVLETYRERLHYVMVDEYQDTNRAQYDLLRALTATRGNLAVVGDDDQSIYGFRGADISNILNFERDYPGTEVVRMEQNYRCGPHILAVANAVVARNTDRIAKRLWTELTDGTRVSFAVADDVVAEARAVARVCDRLHKAGRAWSDFAIIFRTNATSHPFEAALRDRRIPYKVVGGRPFYARREVRDALSYLRLVTNPADDAAFLRVVNVPPRGIGPATLTKLREDAATRGEPLFKTARALSRAEGRTAAALATFVALIDGLTELATTASLPALLQQALERSGYLDMVHKEPGRDATERLDNLRELSRDAARFDPDPPLPGPAEHLAAWLDRMTLMGSDEEVSEAGEVLLMTVHTSKGLEYPVVFVVQMNEGQFPHRRALDERGGVAEERRLAYVAFTRAKERLYVTRSAFTTQVDRAGKPKSVQATPSRFLYGVPAEACDGELPDPASEETRQQSPAPVDVARLRALRTTPQSPPPPAPPAPAAPPIDRRPVRGPADAPPGARVWHDDHGSGEVVRWVGPRVYVRYASGVRSAGADDAALTQVGD